MRPYIVILFLSEHPATRLFMQCLQYPEPTTHHRELRTYLLAPSFKASELWPFDTQKGSARNQAGLEPPEKFCTFGHLVCWTNKTDTSCQLQ